MRVEDVAVVDEGETQKTGRYAVRLPADDSLVFRLDFNPTSAQLHLLLEVYQSGYAAGWMEGEACTREEIRAALGIPAVIEQERVSLTNLCCKLYDRIESVEASSEAQVRTDSLGFVYLMYCVALKHFKIGFSFRPTKRAAEVEKLVGHSVRIVCSIPTLDMRALERSLHAKYAKRRIQGEWFDLTGAEVEEIVALSRAES